MLDVVAEGREEEGEALLAAELVEEAALAGHAEDALCHTVSQLDAIALRCKRIVCKNQSGFARFSLASAPQINPALTK